VLEGDICSIIFPPEKNRQGHGKELPQKHGMQTNWGLEGAERGGIFLEREAGRPSSQSGLIRKDLGARNRTRF